MNIKTICIISFSFLCLASVAFTQEFPAKPVTVIIPFSKGSATDIIAREVSNSLSALWDQSVVGKNIPGKGGTLAAKAVSKQIPDGYTLFVHSSAFAINPSINRNLSYDPINDFKGIAPLVRQPLALVVAPLSNIDSLSGLIAYVKAKKNTLKFGSPGVGSAAHLTAEKFKLQVGLRMEHLPFKGGPETVSALNDGSVVFSFLPVAFAKKKAETGKLNILGVTSIHRSSALPDIPTIAEEGIAGFEYNHWWGIWAPVGISPELAAKIEKDIELALETPELKKLFDKIGAEPMRMRSDEFSKFVLNEIESMKLTVDDAGLKLY